VKSHLLFMIVGRDVIKNEMDFILYSFIWLAHFSFSSI